MRVNIMMDLRMVNRIEQGKPTSKDIIDVAIERLVEDAMSLGQAWKLNEPLFDLPADGVLEEQSTSFRLPPVIDGHGASRTFVRIVVEP